MPRSARINAIKRFQCYTIQEVADVTGVSTRTITTWISKGLPVMTDQRPHLIRGDDLRDFILNMRRTRKTQLALHRFYCLGCRDARHAAEGFAECRIDGNSASLKAICEACGGIINKSVSIARLPELNGKLDLLEEGGGPKSGGCAA